MQSSVCSLELAAQGLQLLPEACCEALLSVFSQPDFVLLFSLSSCHFLPMAFLLLQIAIWISSILLFSDHNHLVRCKHLLFSQKKEKKDRVRYNADFGVFVYKTRK